MFKKIKFSNLPIKRKTKEEVGPIRVDSITEESAVEASLNQPKDYQFRFTPNKTYFTISLYVLCVIALGALIIYGIINIPYISSTITRFFGFIRPFVAAFFIAFIINPIVKLLTDRFFGKLLHIHSYKLRLSLAIFTAYLLIITLIVIFFIYVVPQITNSITELAQRSTDIYKEVEAFLFTLEDHFENLDITFVMDKINESIPEIFTFGTDFVKNVIPMILGVSISIAKIVINILLSIAISVYMLYDKRSLSKNTTKVLYALVPKKKADSMLVVIKECGNIFTSFIVGKAIDSLIIGLLCFIIMSLIGLPYAMLLSVIVGVTNMIPYFGPFIGAVPGILLYLCFDPLQALIFAFVILCLQQFDGWILGPKILGDSTGLTPLWVIFGITVGGAYGGVFGMFLGVPVVAVVAFLANLFISSRLHKKNIEIH